MRDVISIVTISFNQGQFLEECIKSVLSQKHASAEYIVIDAGSTDESREIISAYESDIDQIIFEPDQGPADGLNKGLARCSGNYFAYINADDFYLPGALEKAIRYFEEFPKADVIYGHGFIVNQAGQPLMRAISAKWDLRHYAYGQATVLQQATFFRLTPRLRQIGFNLENRTCWDGELLANLAMAGCSLTRVNDDFACFRLHDASITGQGNHEQIARVDHERIFRQIIGRDPTALDYSLISSLLRVKRLLSDPYMTLSKLFDRARQIV